MRDRSWIEDMAYVVLSANEYYFLWEICFFSTFVFCFPSSVLFFVTNDVWYMSKLRLHYTGQAIDLCILYEKRY